jgi:predicted nucleotidyltransferase
MVKWRGGEEVRISHKKGLTKRPNKVILTPGGIMRLTEAEISAIKQSIYAVDPGANFFLFGSRVDDTKRGGDIDLFVLSEKIKTRERRKIKLNIYDKIGEQKIDMVVTPGISKAFHRIAVSTGVEL